MIDFIVMGLPRSATTWAANWLTTDKTFCLHDPFMYGDEHRWPHDDRRFGIACTAAYLHPEWLARQECPKVRIVRDPRKCDRSLAALGLPDTSGLHSFWKAEGKPFAMRDLFDDNGARFIWSTLLQDIPFDGLRHRQLRDFRIEPHQRVIDYVKAALAQGRAASIKER